MGKTIDKVACYPYYYHRFDKNDNKDTKYDYKATYQRVDSDRLRLRRGDIIRFSNSEYCGFKKDIKGKHGVILERYRIIKEKLNGTFKDYYAVVLITSGKLKGQLQHVGCHKLASLSKQI